MPLVTSDVKADFFCTQGAYILLLSRKTFIFNLI